MKKRLCLVGLLAVVTLPVFAGMNVEDSTTPTVLHNQNYSSEAIRLIQMDKAYANAVPYQEPDANTYKNGNELWDKTTDKVRSFFMYLDPGYDDHKFFNRDIRMTPGWEDL